MDKNFGREYRLSKDTSSIIEKGKRIKQDDIVLYYLPKEKPMMAVVVGKKVGGSVLRNKLKRWPTMQWERAVPAIIL